MQCSQSLFDATFCLLRLLMARGGRCCYVGFAGYHVTLLSRSTALESSGQQRHCESARSAREGKARQLLVAIHQPPIAASNLTVAAARPLQHHPPIRRVIIFQLDTSHCTGDNHHLLRSNLRIVAPTHHNIPSTRSHPRPYPHHEQQLYADASLGAQLDNPQRRGTRSCS